MVEQKFDGLLSEDEAAVYDRQIRLWGYEAQFKLKNAKVCVIGIDGLGAEIVKNIVLSGVKSLLMIDDKVASELDFENQFLIPRNAVGQNRAVASRARAQALNPLVSIETGTEAITTKKSEFFKDFNLIISCNLNPSQNVEIDNLCRENNVPYYAAGIYGTFGYVFYDLNKHKFSKETNVSTWQGDVKKISMETLDYPSFSEALRAEVNTPDTAKNLRKLPPSIFLLKVLIRFEEEHKRQPTESDADYLSLLKISEEVLEGLSPPGFPEVLKCLSSGKPAPVCAILGAVLSQEAVKAVTQKGETHRNFFFFDPIKLVGHVQYIGP